jgi:hypothetical protein
LREERSYANPKQKPKQTPAHPPIFHLRKKLTRWRSPHAVSIKQFDHATGNYEK